MDVLTILAIGALNIACFFIGAFVGQRVSNGKDIEIPSINPVKALEEREDRKKARAEQERMEIIMQNIENYDGTGIGQKEVPRG